ncbi:OmpA family protein [Caldovatus sp. SYSU G05006]|uniref:OmpA family protein n=2 Tax=Caldovatus aquaticus TaxID=2865671 RepID=A0ABS7EZL6_9PROT|nr:OmpA family protein [Caldovatus aquaticus]
MAAGIVLPLFAAAPALAQSDPAALQLIERLRPSGGEAPLTRGIRVPGGTGAAPQGSAPAVAPSAGGAAAEPVPGGKTGGSAGPAVAAPARPPQAAAQPDTTAPPGVPAVSITVTFATGSAALTPSAEAALAPLGRALSSPELAPYRFRIEGHTDTVGDAAMNQALSERRAAAVRDYLIRRFNVDPARLEAVGLGETQPLVPTGDGVPEVRNRRVQVLNIGG